MREPGFFACAKKAQISCAITAQLIIALVFTTLIVQFLFFLEIQNFKLISIFCGCIGRFVSELVGNPEDRFSHDGAHIRIWNVCFCTWFDNFTVEAQNFFSCYIFSYF